MARDNMIVLHEVVVVEALPQEENLPKKVEL